MCHPETWVKKKPFYSNGDFVATKGRKFWTDGELLFPSRLLPEKVDNTYRTAHWANVQHNGIIQSDCDWNTRFALRRMTALVDPPVDFEPDKPEHYRYAAYSVRLSRRQERFILRNQNFFAHLRDIYTKHLDDYLGAREECILHHDDPHAKRMLRIRGYENLLGCGTLFTRAWVKKVTYKMKKNEWAKFGKYARMIGDLGVEASLAGFRITNFLKNAEVAEEIQLNGIDVQFVKSPSQPVLRRVFANLIKPARRGYFCYFSDDSCFSIRIGGKVYFYNIDISSCDASHGPHMFQALIDSTPVVGALDMADLVEQLKCPIRIYSRDDRKHRVLLQCHKPKLYSGSTVTTRINNLANQLIAKSLSETDFSGCQNSLDVRTAIRTAAEQVGYIVTVDDCTSYSDLQFLKHSPVYDTDNQLQPMLNLGVMLRLSGICDGDLPGRGCLKERARLFQAGLLRGVYPRTDFELLRMMRSTVKGPLPDTALASVIQRRTDQILDHKVVSSENDVHYNVEMEEIFRRYPAVKPWMLGELLDFMGNAGYGTVVACEAASLVLEKDYGLICP